MSVFSAARAGVETKASFALSDQSDGSADFPGEVGGVVSHRRSAMWRAIRVSTRAQTLRLKLRRFVPCHHDDEHSRSPSSAS